MNKEELRQYSAKLLGEKEKLQERVDKAIEYITDYSKSLDERIIVDILKGEDKEC